MARAPLNAEFSIGTDKIAPGERRIVDLPVSLLSNHTPVNRLPAGIGVSGVGSGVGAGSAVGVGEEGGGVAPNLVLLGHDVLGGHKLVCVPGPPLVTVFWGDTNQFVSPGHLHGIGTVDKVSDGRH